MSGPAANDDRWFFETRGKQLGPVSLEEVSRLWGEGKLDAQAYCWHAGFSAWIPLAKVALLAKAIAPAEKPEPAVAAAAAVVAPVAAAAVTEPAAPAASPAQVVTFIKPTPVIVGRDLEEDAAPPPRGGLKQSLLTGVVAGAVMATIVFGVQSATRERAEAPAAQAVASAPATSPPTVAPAAAPIAEAVLAPVGVSPNTAPAVPQVAAPATDRSAPTASLPGREVAPAVRPAAVAVGTTPSSAEPSAPRVAVAPPSWNTPARDPIARPPSPVVATVGPVSTPRPAAPEKAETVDDGKAHDEFGPRAFAREFKDTPPSPPKRTVYIPPAPGSGLPDQLTQAQVESVAGNHKAELQRCVDAHRPVTPSSGQIVMRLTLLPDGSVASARAMTDALADTALADCLVAAIGEWQFPKHRAQMEPVELPVAF